MMRTLSRLALGLLSAVTLGWAAPLSSQDDTAATRAQAFYDQGVAEAEHGFSDERLLKALTSLEQAIALAPNWPDPYYSAALMQIRLGRLLPAAANLRTYLRLRPDAPNRALIESLISDLEARAPTAANREVIFEMFETMGDRSVWRMEKTGQNTSGWPPFQRDGDSLRIGPLGPTREGQMIDYRIRLPEAGVGRFIFILKVRGFNFVEPCPCDNFEHYDVKIISRDEFVITKRDVTNNRQMPYDFNAVYRFTRVKKTAAQ